MKRAAAFVALVVANLAVGILASSIGVWGSLALNDLAGSRVPAAVAADGQHKGAAAATASTAGERLGAVALSMGRAIADTFTWMFRGDPQSLVALAVALVAAVAPAMLVVPAMREAPAAPGSRSLKASVAGAATLGGACALGILGTVWDIAGLAVTPVGEEPGTWARGGTLVMAPWILVPAWILSGIVIAWLIRRAGRAHRPDRVDRFVRWIFAGTCVEIAIAAPTYVVAMRRDDCTCSWGSWWAIVAGITSLGVMCGPALVLLATRKARMQWMRGACHHCGYPRHGGAAGPCPECGGLESPAPKAA